MVKIVLLAYSRGLVSSRSIERACRENVTFIAIDGVKLPPDGWAFVPAQSTARDTPR